MTNRRVQRILPLLVLVGVAMPVQANITVEQAEPTDCSAFACLEVAGEPVIVVADEPTAAVMSLYETCPAALQEALDAGAFELGRAIITGCAGEAMTFFMTQHDSATLLSTHEGLMATDSSTSDAPSCIELLYENLVYQVPGVNGVPSILGVIGNTVLIDYRCPTLSLVMYLVEGGNTDVRLTLLGFAATA